MSLLLTVAVATVGCSADAGSDVAAARGALGEPEATGAVAATAIEAEARLTTDLARAPGAEERARLRSSSFAALEAEVAATDDPRALEILSASRETMLFNPEALADGVEVMREGAEAGERYVPTPGDREAARRLEEYRSARRGGVRP